MSSGPAHHSSRPVGGRGRPHPLLGSHPGRRELPGHKIKDISKPLCCNHPPARLPISRCARWWSLGQGRRVEAGDSANRLQYSWWAPAAGQHQPGSSPSGEYRVKGGCVLRCSTGGAACGPSLSSTRGFSDYNMIVSTPTIISGGERGSVSRLCLTMS
jgi:hypothetical protein